MEEEGAGGPRLSKRLGDKVAGEVDYKTIAGTAWSHNFLNQKPWHPLSYPNQRRKWIAEQTHANRNRRADEVSREYAQEQEFFRQTALISKKEKEKVEMMQAVSFMYVRPPGYNAESAKAAEIADESKKLGEGVGMEGTSSSMPLAAPAVNEEKKKHRPKDVFGRALPTAEEFEVLKNAPRLETGAPARVKPFAVEVRNVKCVRCGKFGHQSGDRECPLKDVIMPNEESRLKRDDPLTAIMAHTQPSEPLKWELKQKPGISPPRGGFDPDDPNQQIVAEDIFDEYGGFLGEGDISALLTNFSSRKLKKEKRKYKHEKVPESKERKSRKSKRRKDIFGSDQSDESEPERDNKRSKHKHSHSSRQSNHDEHRQRSWHRRHGSSRKDDGKSSSRKKEKMKSRKRDHSDESSSESSDVDRRHSTKSKRDHHYSSESADSDGQDRNRRHHRQRSSQHSERDNSV
ncbi:putative zinc finger CCHC domain-containing protein [Drosera capensis]